jgi:ATPase subunit of ABC transporter with duplicated ATPase domains
MSDEADAVMAATGTTSKAADSANDLANTEDEDSDDLQPLARFVVCGGTGSGKSTLLNALLGEVELLPTSCMRACTATIIELGWRARAASDAELFQATVQICDSSEFATDLAAVWASGRAEPPAAAPAAERERFARVRSVLGAEALDSALPLEHAAALALRAIRRAARAARGGRRRALAQARAIRGLVGRHERRPLRVAADPVAQARGPLARARGWHQLGRRARTQCVC